MYIFSIALYYTINCAGVKRYSISVTYQLKVNRFKADLPFKSEQLKTVAYFIQKERGKVCQSISTNGSPMNR